MKASKDIETTFRRVTTVVEITDEVVTLKMSEREAAQVYSIMNRLGSRDPRERSTVLDLFEPRPYREEGPMKDNGFTETAQRVTQAIRDSGANVLANIIYKEEDRLS